MTAPLNPVLGGTDKAAIMVMLLAEEDASRILGQLTPDELRQLAGTMCGIGEIEPHILARIGLTIKTVVDVNAHAQVKAVILPALPQFVWRHKDRSEAGRGLGMEKPEPVLEVIENQAAQGNIIAYPDQSNGRTGILSARAHWHMPGDHDHLRLEINSETVFGHNNRC